MLVNSTDLDLIATAICEGRCVLFAGAGLGQQCGLPGWEAALESLATLVETDDAAIAVAMRARISDKLFLDAAELFRLSKLTNQAKLEALLKVFDRTVTADSYVRELLDLPFRAFVTTNYDAIIEDTVAALSKQHLTSFRNTPTDLKSAVYCRKRYVASSGLSSRDKMRKRPAPWTWNG